MVYKKQTRRVVVDENPTEETSEGFIPNSEEELAVNARRIISKKMIVIPLVLVFVLALGLGFMRNSDGDADAEKQAAVDAEREREEIALLLEQVGRHILISTEEEPIVATVTDAEALIQEQLFYHGVSNGDKVLIYPQSRRAIVYSPERDILVNVGPVIASNPDQPVSTQSPPADEDSLDAVSEQ